MGILPMVQVLLRARHSQSWTLDTFAVCKSENCQLLTSCWPRQATSVDKSDNRNVAILFFIFVLLSFLLEHLAYLSIRNHRSATPAL